MERLNEGVYSLNLAGIQGRLAEGVKVRRKREVPLTHRQIVRLEWHRDLLLFRAEHGSKAKLPQELKIRNPHISGFNYKPGS
jgi:hypothetical protein